MVCFCKLFVYFVVVNCLFFKYLSWFLKLHYFCIFFVFIPFVSDLFVSFNGLTKIRENNVK